MPKQFKSRISKKKRTTIDITDKLGRNIFLKSDQKLLDGALLDKINLADIIVKEQVRTKFNDSSISNLAKNIEANGLIQPLVVHRVGSKYTLVCGERRYRAMQLIKKKEVSCYILENKTEQELMAIQFSENSSREALHYIDKANGILNYQMATHASERKIQLDLGISKSEVHRSLLIARMTESIKSAAKNNNIEKYVLVEFDALSESELKKKIERQILIGGITKRSELRSFIRNGGMVKTIRKKKSTQLKRTVTANAFIKAMNSKTENMDIDPKTKELLNNIMKETKEMVDF